MGRLPYRFSITSCMPQISRFWRGVRQPGQVGVVEGVVVQDDPAGPASPEVAVVVLDQVVAEEGGVRDLQFAHHPQERRVLLGAVVDGEEDDLLLGGDRGEDRREAPFPVALDLEALTGGDPRLPGGGAGGVSGTFSRPQASAPRPGPCAARSLAAYRGERGPGRERARPCVSVRRSPSRGRRGQRGDTALSPTGQPPGDVPTRRGPPQTRTPGDGRRRRGRACRQRPICS